MPIYLLIMKISKFDSWRDGVLRIREKLYSVIPYFEGVG